MTETDRDTQRAGPQGMAAAPETTARASIDPKMLEALICPVTHTRLELSEDRSELISRAAGLAYPIRDGIPVMLPDEARRLDQ